MHQGDIYFIGTISALFNADGMLGALYEAHPRFFPLLLILFHKFAICEKNILIGTVDVLM